MLHIKYTLHFLFFFMIVSLYGANIPSDLV
jgi:hypothetical protein